MQMTEMQAARAFALATAYGHEWAIEENSGVLDIEQIRANTEAAASGFGPIGLRAPQVDGDSEWANVVHTTGTGRTRWEIAPDGTVRVFIDRPTVHGSAPWTVIAFTVLPDGSVDETIAIDRERCRDRHVEAAITAYEAILDSVEGLNGVLFRERLMTETVRDPSDAQLALLVMRHFDRLDHAKLWDLVMPYCEGADYPDFIPATANPTPPEWRTQIDADTQPADVSEYLMSEPLTDDDLAALPKRVRS